MQRDIVDALARLTDAIAELGRVIAEGNQKPAHRVLIRNPDRERELRRLWVLPRAEWPPERIREAIEAIHPGTSVSLAALNTWASDLKLPIRDERRRDFGQPRT